MLEHEVSEGCWKLRFITSTQAGLQEAALAEGRDHPLLERVRQCSATPDLAVDFFKRILHPCPMCRLGDNALFHRYLKATTLQMQKQLTRPGEGCCSH